MNQFKQYENLKANMNKTQLAEFNRNGRFLEVAMYTEMIRLADLEYAPFIDGNGHPIFYELAMEIVDEILYSDNSEFLKYWKLHIATNGKATDNYFHYMFDTCMDWYFMTEATKELKIQLKGHEGKSEELVERAEIEHRMKMILDDLKVIKGQLEEETLAKHTAYSDSLDVHFNNIEIATNLADKECLGWIEYEIEKESQEEKGVMHPKVKEIIDLLNSEVEVDGETIQYIVEQVGMHEQLGKQLLACYPSIVTDHGQELLEKIAKKVWDDIYNNDTLTFNTFEEYWNGFKL